MTDNALALVDGKIFTKRDMFSAIDAVAEDLHITNDIRKATNVLNQLGEIDTVTGKAKAKLLWHMNTWWKENKKGEDFADHITSETSIKHRKTVLEYVNVWEQIEQERIPKKIQERPMRDLVPIGNMLAQGFEPSKSEWSSIQLAGSDSDLLDTISKIKKKPRRKNARNIWMGRDGSIYVQKKDAPKKYVGFLDIEEEDVDVVEAINFITNNRITRR